LNLLRITGLTGAAVAVVGAVTVASASCSQTPTNVPVRTFEQAQRVDFVCIAVNDDDGNPLPASKLQPLPQDNCSPVPVGGNTATFPNHLYAVAARAWSTRTTRRRASTSSPWALSRLTSPCRPTGP
jgi:hypothetical protein